MRMTLMAAGVLIAAPAAAHDVSAPISGEDPVEHTHVGDELLELIFPAAEAAADITVDGRYRRIRANGYPDIAPGQFPNRGNPHSISRKNYNLKVPLNPRKKGRATNAQGSVFGIAINGVVMDPGTAEYWQNDRRSGWNYEALGGACKLGLDKYNAHVQPDGTYHYHGIPTGVVNANGGRSVPALIGYAADGFPIYGPYGYSDPARASSMKKLKSSYRVKSGTRPGGPGGRYNGKFTQDWTYAAGSGDLDQCNGRFAVTPEYPDGTYHYVLTDSFPHIPRCWMGTPDSSFARLKRGPGGQRRGDAGDLQETDGAQLEFAGAAVEEGGGALTLNAAFSDETVPLLLTQHRPPPPRLRQGGRPPQGAGRRQGGQRQGRGPCSGS